MSEQRRELTYQKHIMDSYALQNGRAKKWASEWQKGPPDLVCALPKFGVHLMEVKHRPTWSIGKEYKNPLTDKQLDECRSYWEAGGPVMGGVVIGEKAIRSTLVLFPVQLDTIILLDFLSTEYKVGLKYNVHKVLSNFRSQYGWRT